MLPHMVTTLDSYGQNSICSCCVSSFETKIGPDDHHTVLLFSMASSTKAKLVCVKLSSSTLSDFLGEYPGEYQCGSLDYYCTILQFMDNNVGLKNRGGRYCISRFGFCYTGLVESVHCWSWSL